MIIVKIDYFDSNDIIDLKSKAIKGAAINVIAQALCFIIRTGGTIILARLLVPGDFGLVTMVTTVSLLLLNFGYNGFPEYIIQKKDITHKEVSSIFWFHAFCSLILSIGLILFSPLLALFYKEPILKPITIVMSVCIITQMLSTYPKTILQRIMNYKSIAVNNILTSLLSVVLAIFIAIKGYGVWAVVARQVSEQIFTMIFLWISCHWIPSRPGSLKSIFVSIKYALNVYANFLLQFFERNLDKIILGKFFGSTNLGYYDRAYYLSYFTILQVFSPIDNVGFSTLSKLKNDPDRFKKYYQKAISALSLLGFFLSLLLIVLGGDIIFILLGKEWKVAGEITQIFGLGIGIMLIYSTYTWLHMALGKPANWFYWNLTALIIRIILIITSAFFGLKAVAASISISYYFLIIPSLWFAGRPINLKIFPILKDILRFFIPALLTLALYKIITININYVSDFLKYSNFFLRIIIEFLMIFIGYICFIIIINRSFKPLIENLDLFKIFFKRKKNNEIN